MNISQSPETLNGVDAMALAETLAHDPSASEQLSGFGRVALRCLIRYRQEGGPVNAARAQVIVERLATVAPGPIITAHWPMDGE
tara:strand:- start:39522 stop:39773 length:252 start_codon:yes stop_codon:yes gene_type:complete